MASHISMRGKIIDFNRLRLDNATQIPLGNAPVNAKGDLIDESGIILKTEEQLEAEYKARMSEQKEISKNVDIKSNSSIAAAAGTPEVKAAKPKIQKQLDVDDANFDPVVELPDTTQVIDSAPAPVTPKARRKIVESDE